MIHPIFFAPFYIPMLFLVGLFSIAAFNPFSWAYLFVSAVFVRLSLSMKEGTVRKKWDELRERLSILGGAQILLWLSLWLSTRAAPKAWLENIYLPIQTAGFPFRTFEYPHPPMGGDIPPAATWPLFFLNYAFWFFVAHALASLLKNVPEQKMIKIRAAFFFVGTIFSIMGLGYLLLKFD